MKATFKVKVDLTPAMNVTDNQLEYFLTQLRNELMTVTADAINERKPNLIETSQLEILPAKIKD